MIKYYTDTHDVDEDLRAMFAYSGHWDNGAAAGVVIRYVDDLPSDNYYDFVASSDI